MYICMAYSFPDKKFKKIQCVKRMILNAQNLQKNLKQVRSNPRVDVLHIVL